MAVHAAHIRVGMHRTTPPIVKLYQLEFQATNHRQIFLLSLKHVHKGMLLPRPYRRYPSGQQQ